MLCATTYSPLFPLTVWCGPLSDCIRGFLVPGEFAKDRGGGREEEGLRWENKKAAGGEIWAGRSSGWGVVEWWVGESGRGQAFLLMQMDWIWLFNRARPDEWRAQLTASAEFGVGDAVEVVVAESELEDARLLQLEGDVGHRDAVADHGAVLGSWKTLGINTV